MLKEKLITKETGLKIEDCAVIAQTANMFKSSIFIIKANKKINAKSIMGVISLNMKHNDTVYLSAIGDDEDEAFEAVYNIL